MNYISFFSNYLPSFLSTSASPAEDLQLAIQEGYTSTIQSTDPALLNTPMPNGELPLNFAVRESKHESIKTLLELGCDPLLTDDQGLNALSTAYLKENYDLVAELLNRFISKDVKISQEIQNNPAASKKTAQIEALSQDNEKWIPYIKKKGTFLIRDKNWGQQMKDLILGNPIEDLTLLTKNQSSYLHTAILLKDNQVIEKLLEHPNIDKVINLKDKDGFTPLQYAAALGKLDLMKKLIEKGAQYQSENNEDISCIALFAAHLQHSHPSSIGKLDAAIFLCSTILWAGQLLPVGTINGRLLQALQAGRQVATLNIPSILMAVALTRSDLFGSYQGIFTAVNALLTANLAYHTFQGLRSCWRNAVFGPQKSLMKAVVSYLPRVDIVYNNVKSIGEQLGYLQKVGSTALEELTQRDIKCFEMGRGIYTNSIKHCLGLSEQIYNNEDTIDKEVYTKSYDDFIERMKLWNERYFLNAPCNRNLDCEDKKNAIWNKCDYGESLNSETCKHAEEIFTDGLNNGFQSNEDFKHEKYGSTEQESTSFDPIKEALKNAKIQDATFLLFGKKMTKSEASKLSLKKLKNAFRKEARKASPDKPTGSHKEMVNVKEAYDLLLALINS